MKNKKNVSSVRDSFITFVCLVLFSRNGGLLGSILMITFLLFFILSVSTFLNFFSTIEEEEKEKLPKLIIFFVRSKVYISKLFVLLLIFDLSMILFYIFSGFK